MSTEEKEPIEEGTEDSQVETDNETAIDPEDEKRSGLKDNVRNVDALVDESDIATEVEKTEDAKPSFFIKKSARKIVELDVLTSKADGNIVSVSRVGMGIDFEKDFPNFKHTVLRFEFSIPNYEDMSTYRQRSSVYRREIQQTMVDKLSLRNFLIVWHLKDWNIPDENGEKIELFFDKSGALTEESIATVYSLSPSLVDVVMTQYEKLILLT
jgi:hypothetical protein